jgi:hypothetical protein
MPLKKQPLNDNEIPIYDEALIYQRGEYWQMRMWLTKERKYARFSLRTRNRDTAIDKAKKHYHELMAQQLSGKTYFSMTTKQAILNATKFSVLCKYKGFFVVLVSGLKLQLIET